MPHSLDTVREISTRVPEAFREMVAAWYEEGDFDVLISRERKTKQGDYRFIPAESKHQITINENLNPWSFLITYAHEVAHFKVYSTYGHGRPHHGREWKNEFRSLLLQILSRSELPDRIARPLAMYAKNPRASTSTFHPLIVALKSFDHQADGNHLYDFQPGDSFQLNGQIYTFLNRRRTRALCEQHSTGRKYLISMAAFVEKI